MLPGALPDKVTPDIGFKDEAVFQSDPIRHLLAQS